MLEDCGDTEAISPGNLRREFWRILPHEWKTIYRYHGFIPLIRCLVGTRKLMQSGLVNRGDGGLVDCLTFSVIPEISTLWTTFLGYALDCQKMTVLLGDGSGIFPSSPTAFLHVLPIFNFNHGVKLDLFMQKACHAEYVLVCDDDLFWLDDEPIRYALNRFSENSKLAVVSLHPRPEKNSQLVEHVGQPMGSYCLIIRRSIWLKENLSFKYYKPESLNPPIYFFDTADYANLQLIQKGYDVEIAPEEIREHIVTFYGTSMWGIKIMACRGEINKVINPSRPDEHKKILRTALALSGFQDLINSFKQNGIFLIKRQFLDQAELLARKELDERTIREVEGDAYLKLDLLRASLLKSISEEKRES